MSRLALIFAFLIALPILALLALVLTLDNVDVYKEQLGQTFQRKTGLELVINGDVTLGLLPPLTLEIEQIEITPPDLDIPLASLKSASIDIKILPLIFQGGKFEINGILIDGLNINAALDEQGIGNWEVVTAESDSKEPIEPAESKDAAEATSAEAGLDLDIAAFSLTDSFISYQDLSANTHYELQIIELTTGQLKTGRPTDLAINLLIEDKIAQTSVSTTVDGLFAINENLKLILEEISIKASVRRKNQPEITPTFLLNGEIDTEKGIAEFNNSSFNLSTLQVLFAFKANNITDVAGIRGNITIPEFNAAQFMRDIGIRPSSTANPKALSSVSFSADMTGTTSQIVFSNLDAKLDDSTIKGQVTTNIDPNPGVDFSLEMDTLNISDYLAPEKEDKSGERGDGLKTVAGPETRSTNVAEPIEDSEVIPVELFNEIILAGKFELDQLSYDDYLLDDINFSINNQNQRLIFNTKANAYEGNLALNLVLTRLKPGQNPQGHMVISVRDINTTQLTTISSITGSLSMESDMRFSGNMLSELLASLDGKSEFTVSDGTLDVTPIKAVANMVDSFRGKPSSVSEWPDLLPFRQLVGEHNVSKGLAQDQTFSFSLENMEIEGRGGLDYFANTLEYDVEAILKENVDGEFTVNPQLAGLRWPLHCEGSLDDSAADLCFPDSKAVTKLVADIAKQEVSRRGKDKIIEKVPDEYKDLAKKLLKGLFDNDR